MEPSSGDSERQAETFPPEHQIHAESRFVPTEDTPVRHAAASEAQTTGDHAPEDTEALVYVPCTARDSGRSEIQIALKPLEDGRLAMLVFTSLDLLVTGCGEQQPWVALPESALEDTFRSSAADVVAVDAGLTAEQRWGAGNEPVTLSQHQRAQTSNDEEE